MSIDNLLVELKKSRRRYWFGTCWKSQNEQYRGCSNYEKLDDMLRAFEAKINGVRWAYAIHEKGHNIDEYAHENCEHKHFVIMTENPISGNSILNQFPQCHIEMIKYDVSNCARYLLHLTATSIHKHRVSMDDLYCSGKGLHGEIWFPLVTSQLYSTFVPNEVLHYVLNDDMSTMFEFISRFGASVAHGAYSSMIKECIEAVKKGNMYSERFFTEVYNLLSETNKQGLLSICGFSEREIPFVDGYQLYQHLQTATGNRILYHFMCLYVWWKNSSSVANDKIKALIQTYNFDALKEINDERVNLQNLLKSNSAFGEGNNVDNGVSFDMLKGRLA